MMIFSLIWACAPKSTADTQADTADTDSTILESEVDNDGDGFPESLDCDDNDSGISPDAPEIPNDGIDQDCDGSDLESPILNSDSSDYAFGSVAIGCSEEAEVLIVNDGLGALELSSAELQMPNSPFALFNPASGNAFDFPISIPADDTQSIGIRYTPLTESTDNDTLSFTSNDIISPAFSLSLSGSGLAEAYGEDEYRQGGGASKADIIFAVDISPSMLQMNYPTYLYESINGLTDRLIDNNIDFRLSAVATSSGCVNGSTLYIDNSFSSADIQSTFEDMINVQNTYSGNGDENLQTLGYALDATSQGGCNEGLLRPESSLNLIGVSEEDDESPMPYTAYVSNFQSYVSDSGDLMVHGIGSDPVLCGASNYYAGVYDASLLTGGSFFSICTTRADWFLELGDLADHITTHAGSDPYLETITLSSPAIAESIQITVDGTPLTIGWSYSETNNSITFDSSMVPETNQLIYISYVIPASCEE